MQDPSHARLTGPAPEEHTDKQGSNAKGKGRLEGERHSGFWGQGMHGAPLREMHRYLLACSAARRHVVTMTSCPSGQTAAG